MKPDIIGISGKIGAGKDTLADWLVANKVFGTTVVLSLAKPLKDVCSTAFGWSSEFMANRATKEAVDQAWGFSPRTAMQQVGTEFRKLFGDDIWVRALDNRITALSGHCQTVVVPDVRFENESDYIRNSGGAIIHMRIVNDDALLDKSVTSHSSEAGILVLEKDLVILNDKKSGLPALHKLFANVVPAHSHVTGSTSCDVDRKQKPRL